MDYSPFTKFTENSIGQLEWKQLKIGSYDRYGENKKAKLQARMPNAPNYSCRDSFLYELETNALRLRFGQWFDTSVDKRGILEPKPLQALRIDFGSSSSEEAILRASILPEFGEIKVKIGREPYYDGGYRVSFQFDNIPLGTNEWGMREFTKEGTEFVEDLLQSADKLLKVKGLEIPHKRVLEVLIGEFEMKFDQGIVEPTPWFYT